MTFTKTLSAALISTFALVGTAAANPIEKITIAKDGIDVVPIEVKAGSNSFQSVKTQSHKFGIKLYAKAKWGKKVRNAVVVSGHAAVFEAAGNKWGKGYSNNSRTFSKHLWPNIPLSKVTYVGKNPVQACNQKLASHRNALNSGANTTVTVKFEFEVTNKKKIGAIGGYKKTEMWYPVKVKCLPKTGSLKIGS